MRLLADRVQSLPAVLGAAYTRQLPMVRARSLVPLRTTPELPAEPAPPPAPPGVVNPPEWPDTGMSATTISTSGESASWRDAASTRATVRKGITSDSSGNRTGWLVSFPLSGGWAQRMARTGPSGWRGASVRFLQSATRSSISSTTCPIRTSLPAGPTMASVRVARFPDLDRDVGHGPFFAALVRVDDGSRSPVPEPQLRRDLLGDYETYRPGVDDPFDRRSSDVRFDAQSEVYGSAVVPVLQRHAGSNLSHRPDPRILTYPELRVHRVSPGLVLLGVGVISAFRPAGRLYFNRRSDLFSTDSTRFSVIGGLSSRVYCRF